MSIAEAVIEKLNALPPEQQAKVLDFVEELTAPTQPVQKAEPYAWMKVAMSLNLDGPADMSEHLDDYLYGEKKNGL